MGGRSSWPESSAEVDLRVGGSYRLSAQDPDSGAVHTVGGTYREVQRPERLVYSWRWELDAGGFGHESVVTVRFAGDGRRTTVVIEHTGLESAESRDRHGHGWNACLDNLAARVFASAPDAS